MGFKRLRYVPLLVMAAALASCGSSPTGDPEADGSDFEGFWVLESRSGNDITFGGSYAEDGGTTTTAYTL